MPVAAQQFSCQRSRTNARQRLIFFRCQHLYSFSKTWGNLLRLGSRFQLSSNFPADEVAFWKWQEHGVDSRIIFGTVQELRLEAGGSYVVDYQQSAGYETWDHFLVSLGVELRGLKIGEAKRDLLKTGGVVESVAMSGLDR